MIDIYKKDITMQWIAFIVMAAVSNPAPLVFPDKSEPVSVTVGGQSHKKPNIDISVTDQPGQHIEKIIGVESNVNVYTPTATTLKFDTAELCDIAAGELAKMPQIMKVICIRTQ
jgi:hypothetical protein